MDHTTCEASGARKRAPFGSLWRRQAREKSIPTVGECRAYTAPRAPRFAPEGGEVRLMRLWRCARETEGGKRVLLACVWRQLSLGELQGLTPQNNEEVSRRQSVCVRGCGDQVSYTIMTRVGPQSLRRAASAASVQGSCYTCSFVVLRARLAIASISTFAAQKSELPAS
jgi:hypothetical protein